MIAGAVLAAAVPVPAWGAAGPAPSRAGGTVAALAAATPDVPAAFTLRDPRITESSGLAASRTHPGIYWTHNDSDDGPYVYAVDGATGRTVATVTLRGVEPRDVEAVSVGPDGDVYVGDIGDNLGGAWEEVWIHRFREPAELADTTVTATRYTVRYADGPRDAESLMVHPRTGRLYIADKDDDGKGGVYAGPERLSSTEVNVFRRIAGTKVWATDGAFSPDGTRLVLRGYFGAEMYRWTSEGRPEPIGPVSVPLQRQGESVTFAPGGRALMYGSEGVHSRVRPRELDGDLLPESAAARGGRDDPAGAADDGADRAADDAGSGAPTRTWVIAGAVVLALAVLRARLRSRTRRRS